MLGQAARKAPATPEETWPAASLPARARRLEPTAAAATATAAGAANAAAPPAVPACACCALPRSEEVDSGLAASSTVGAGAKACDFRRHAPATRPAAAPMVPR